MIIYKTTNLVNGKIYIGQDSNNNPNYLGSGKILYQAIEKYGIENFKKEILEICNSKEKLNEREIYWIEKLNSRDRSVGYNITVGGNGGDTYSNNPNKDIIYEKMCISNRNLTPERINKLKEKCSGWHQTEDVKQIISEKNSGEKNGMHDKTYYDIWVEKYGKEIADEKMIDNKKLISKNTCGVKNGMYGKKTYDLWLNKYGKEIADKKQYDKFKNLNKPINQFDLNNYIIKEYLSIKQAVEETSISRGSIGNCLIGRSKTAGGFIWKYKENNI